MQIVVVAGPLPPGQAGPEFPHLERFVRRPRPGEASIEGPCPACSGAGTLARRAGRLRSFSSCDRCHGSGNVEGVHLVRLVADEGSRDVAALLAWAREHHLRADVQMLLHTSGGEGWELRWCSIDDRHLRQRRDQFVAHRALAVLVDLESADIHVALHVVREDGHIAVAGLWNVCLADDGALVRRWSERASRSAAWRWHIRFPAEVVHEAVEGARTSLVELSRPAGSVSDAAKRPPATTPVSTSSSVQAALS